MNGIGTDEGENRTDAMQQDVPQWLRLRSGPTQPGLQEGVPTLSCMSLAAQNSTGNLYLSKVRVSSLISHPSHRIIMHLILLSLVQRQLWGNRTPHSSINRLLSRRARLPLSCHHTHRPALIPSHLHPRLPQKFTASQPLSCRNLSKPARQLEKQSVLRRSASRSVFYRF